jgi:hypothetical protein
MMNPKLLATLCAIAFSAGPAVSQTATLYADDFTGGTDGSLNSQAPQVRPGTETWRSPSGYAKATTGEGTVTTNGEGAAHLPIPTLDSNLVYTLTARVFNTTTTTNWIAIGWTQQTTNTSQGWNRPNTGENWILWRGNDEIRVFEGPGATASVGGTGTFVAGENEQIDLRVVLDLPANTATYLYKNPSASEWTQFTSNAISSSRLDRIQSVGFSTDSTGSRGLISFQLTTDGTIPSDPYLAWAGEGVLFGDDANGDGVSNGLAFLLGSEGPADNALGLVPTVSENAGGLVMNFSMLNSTVRGTASLAIEYSNSLEAGSWTTVSVPDTEDETVDGNVTFNVTSGDPLNTVTATISSAAAGGGKLFGRIKASE